MTIDFNNCRKQLLYAFEELTEKLNDAVVTREDQYALPNAFRHNQETNLKGYVLIDADDIQSQMDELRSIIYSISATHMKDKPELMSDVYIQVYPENSDKEMPWFNDKKEVEA